MSVLKWPSVFLLVFTFSNLPARPVSLMVSDSLRGITLFEKGKSTYYSNRDSSFYYFKEAIEPLFRAGLYDHYVNCHNALHNIADQNRDFIIARSYAEKASELASRHLTSLSTVSLTTKQNMGTRYLNEGLYEKAGYLLEEAIEAWRNAPKKDYIKLTTAYLN
mgnify:CR=1 FL=1